MMTTWLLVVLQYNSYALGWQPIGSFDRVETCQAAIVKMQGLTKPYDNARTDKALIKEYACLPQSQYSK